jgi:hypothetical protein
MISIENIIMKRKENGEDVDSIILEIKELGKYVLLNFDDYIKLLDYVDTLVKFIKKLDLLLNDLRAGVLLKRFCGAGGY